MANPKELAQRVAEQTGINPDIIYGQWALESDNFSNWCTTTANNFGGLKQFKEQPDWFTGDAKSPEGDNYQVFGSPEEYADYYARYISKYYPDALNAKTPEDFARALYNGSYYGGQGSTDDEKVANYAAGIRARSQGTWDLPGNFSGNAYGVQPGGIPTKEPEPLTFGDYLKNKWAEGFYDNALVGLGRTLWAGATSAVDPNYQPSIDDYNYVTKALPNDPIAQRWALFNAQSKEGLYKLVAMKQQDSERESRIEAYKGNWATNVAGFGSGLVGSVMGDPTTLLPVIGQEAVGLKMLGALGTKTAASLSTSKILRYAEIGAQQAGINVLSRYGAEQYAGFQQDYTSAALMGAAAGFGFSALGDLLKKVPRFESTKGVLGALDNLESHAITTAGDMKAPNELPKLRDVLEQAHDTSFAEASGSPMLSKLAQAGKVLAVNKADIEPLATKLGINLKTTKAFHVPDEGLTVIVKDALQNGDNIDNLLAHEIGVHANLKDTIGEDAYNSLAQTVQERMANPDKSWQAAMRAVPDGGWEETLGHRLSRRMQQTVTSQQFWRVA